MRRSSLAAALVAAPLAVLAMSCASDDGRQLRPPTPAERVEATNAASTTTTTIAGGPVVSAAGTVGPAGSGSPASTTLTIAPPATTATTVASSFVLTAPWTEGAAIATAFTCDGRERSPALSWTAPPPGTVELALVVTDDDIGFLHWAMTGLAATAGALPENDVPADLVQGFNDFAVRGWSGPCPPAGSTHTYRFELFALRQPPQLPEDPDARQMVIAIEGVQFATASVTGTYTRPG